MTCAWLQTDAGASAFELRTGAGVEDRLGAGPETLPCFFKHDCPTCDLVAPSVEPVWGALARRVRARGTADRIGPAKRASV